MAFGEWPFGELPFGEEPAPPPSGGTALTAVTATGSVGTVKAQITYALTGASATGSVGTVVSQINQALTAASANGSLGTVVSAVTYGLSGVTGTGSAGTVTPPAAGNALTGVTGTGSVGNVGANITNSGTGTTGTGSAGNVGPQISQAISAVSGSGNPGIPVSSVTYSLSGVTGIGSVGTVSASGDKTVALTGVTGSGSVGNVGYAAQDNNGWLGGPIGRRRKKHHWLQDGPTPEEVKRQRIELGIIEEDPEPIAPAVKKLIRQVAKKVTAPEIDNTQAIQALQEAMDKQKQRFRKEAADLLIRQRDEMRSRDIAYAAAVQKMREREDDNAAAYLLLH